MVCVAQSHLGVEFELIGSLLAQLRSWRCVAACSGEQTARDINTQVRQLAVEKTQIAGLEIGQCRQGHMQLIFRQSHPAQQGGRVLG